jgi:hypothetical protein
VPSGLIEDENSMCARRHLGGDFVEMALHGLSVAPGEDDGGADAAPWANGAKDIG